MIIGAHLSVMDGVEATVRRAKQLCMNAVSIFLGSPKSYEKPVLDRYAYVHTDVDITVHAPYILNPAASGKKERAVEVLRAQVAASSKIGAKRIVVHPGSATDCTRIEALDNLVDAIKPILGKIDIAVETMVGSGNQIGKDFDELKYVLDRLPETVGVCLDTCHMHDAGFDLFHRTDLVKLIDSSIGLHRVKIIHVNGSLNPRGSRKDRHAFLCDPNNKISPNLLRSFIQMEPFKDIPKILETFEDEDTLLMDLALLRKTTGFKSGI